MSRSLSRTALELCRPIPRLPPTYLLPVRARWIASSTTTTTTTSSTSTLDAPDLSATGPVLRNDTTSFEPPSPQAQQQTSSSIHNQVTAAAAAFAFAESSLPTTNPNVQIPQKNKPPSREPPTAPPPVPTTPIPQSIKDALPLLRAQPGHYITFHIHGRPYLVTPGDTVRLPFQIPGVHPGDILRLNRASVLGSRDFTIKPGHLTAKPDSNEPAYIDERLYELRAVVAGVDAEPMREMEKTKRRNRKVKTVKTKLRYTVLRISELKIARPEDLP